jgi:isopenicillin-N epimerase
MIPTIGGPPLDLHDASANVTADALVHRIRTQIRPETRVLAFTWVHSSTGLKIPARAIADVVADANAGRADADRLLFCLDGVHGLGVEPDPLPSLGCDFFMAGTHKWLFGPRGTGILWGRPETQQAVTPTIPTFSRQSGWGPRMTPGGFKPFEHQWAMPEAFRFHQDVGKENVAERIHRLARQTKEGLARMPHVRLHTPMDDALSAGIVCFEVEGMGPETVVRRLRDRRIGASTTPYSPSYARLAPGLLKTTHEVDLALAAIHDLA